MKITEFFVLKKLENLFNGNCDVIVEFLTNPWRDVKK